MKTKLFLLVPTLILLSCNNQSGKTNAQSYDVNYESYYNERYDYAMDYPDFLILQDESDSQDAQTFMSEDMEQALVVYHTLKGDRGITPSIETAFQQESEALHNIIDKQLFDNYYFIKGEIDKGLLYKQYSFLANDNYFNMRFEYPEKDEKLFEAISKHVSESFNVGTNGDYGVSEEFMTFIEQFLNDCYWNVNFNTLLRDNDKRLAKYIDPKMDIRRYYNPGAIAHLYARADKFGFDDYTDFVTKPRAIEVFALYPLDNDAAPCDIDFVENNTVLYYQSTNSVPDVVVNTETYETASVELPYPDAQMMVVYLPNYFKGNPTAPRAFYFIKTPSGWKLAFVDDSLCSA